MEDTRTYILIITEPAYTMLQNHNTYGLSISIFTSNFYGRGGLKRGLLRGHDVSGRIEDLLAADRTHASLIRAP